MSFVAPSQAGGGFQFPVLGQDGPITILVSNDSDSQANCRLGFADVTGVTLNTVGYEVPAKSVELKFLADEIDLPAGQGLWPAFWLLPQENAYGGWAASGEIDIMEAVNPGAVGGNTVHGTIHYGGA